MKGIDAAWLAGYIDGDGCICLEKKPGRKYRSLRLVIDSADPELLEEAQRIAGGKIVKKTKYSDHHRQCWSWRLLGAGNVSLVLSHIEPHLRCRAKKERAQIVLSEWQACTPRNGRYTQDLAAAKELFEERFLSLGEGRGKRASSA